MLLLRFAILIIIFTAKAEILEVCPNPFNSNAEYVKVRCNSSCILSDGEGEIILSRGLFYIAKNSSAFKEEFGFEPDLEFRSRFALSNVKDEIYLYEDGKLIDSFSYRRPDKGLIYVKKDGSWDFRYEGWTDFKPVKDYVEGEVIVTPSNFVFEADTIVSYTFTTDRYVMGNYKLYLDANPVGGVPINEFEISKNHETVFLKSNVYRFFHWKFGLNGDEVVITTENWRWEKIGFIVHFRSENVSRFLRDVIRHDEKYSSEPKSFCEVKAFKTIGGKGKVYRFEGEVEVFVLPDFNIIDIMKNAKRRIYVIAPYIRFKNTDLLDVFRTKCEIKVITSDERTAEYLKEFANRNNIDMNVRLIPNVHGKMIVVDDLAIVTSANLDEFGLKRNREVGVILKGDVVDDLVEIFDESEDYTVVAIVVLALTVIIAYIKLRT